MIKDRSSFFAQLALMDALKDNLLSIILAKNPNVDISKREPFFDNVSKFYSIYTLENREDITEIVGTNNNSIDSWLNSDLRIKNVKIKSVRGFPDSQIPFGIDFCEDGEISSMIILGNNASGKSSLYDAIEFNYCKRIGETELRTSEPLEDDDDNFKEFLKHFNNPFEESICDVETNNKLFNLHDINIPKEVRDKINPNSHFISDFDIYKFGKLDYQKNGNQTFQNLVAQNIGLSEFLEIEKQLYTFANYSRRIESTLVSNLSKEIDSAKKIIETTQASIVQKTAELKALENDKVNSKVPENIKLEIGILAELKKISFSYQFDFDIFTKEIETYKLLYTQYITSSNQNRSLEEIQFLNLGISLLENHSDCPFCNSSKLSIEEIRDEVKNRIQQIQEANKLSKELNSGFNNVVELFDSLFSNFRSLKAKVNQALMLINNTPLYNTLTNYLHELLGFLNNLLSNDLLLEIDKMNENPDFIKDKFKFSYRLINQYEAFSNEELSNFLSTILEFNQNYNKKISELDYEFSEKLNNTSVEAQIAILKNEIQKFSNQIQQYKKDVDRKTPELLKATKQLELFQKVKSETKEYYKQFHGALVKETQQAFEPIKSIVKSILDQYLYDEDRSVNLIIENKPDEIDEETGEVVSEIITAYIKPRDGKHPPLSVNKYFNTFHFRLFCAMVGISIAVASRKITGINLPLVFDDIFYSSDFEKRLRIEEFIEKLFKLFKEFTPDKPLQLIIFTHDQVVFESAISAVQQVENEPIQFGKLFPYQEAEKKEDFYNLIFKMPSYLPQRLYQNHL